MLAPDDIGPILNSLKEFYFMIRTADKVAFAGKTTRVSPISEKSKLCKEVNRCMEWMYNSGVQWENLRIRLISDVVSSF